MSNQTWNEANSLFWIKHQMVSFRGDYGDEYFCDVLSILETLRLRKLNLFKEISSRFALQ